MGIQLTAAAIDRTKEVEGVPVTHPEHGWTMLTGMLWNADYRAWYAARLQDTRGENDDGSLSQAQTDELLREATIRFCFVGWDGPTDENDEPIEWSVEFGLELFKPEGDYGHLFAWWQTEAANRKLFQSRALEVARGKSELGSGGSTKTVAIEAP